MPTPIGYPQPRASQFVADAELVTAPYGTDGIISGNHISTADLKRFAINCYYTGGQWRAITTGYCAVLVVSSSGVVLYTSGAVVAAGGVVTLIAAPLVVGGITSSSALVEAVPAQGKIVRFAASDVSREFQAGPWTDYDATYTEVASYTVPLGYIVSGTVRVKFDLRRSIGSSFAVYGRIYVNGVAVGTERSTISETFVGYSEDITVSPGDLISLYIHGSGDDQAEAKNFSLCASDTVSEIVKDEEW